MTKIATVANLQEAYQQIEYIEQEARKSEKQKQRERVVNYRETGRKPEDWKRGTDDKAAQRMDELDDIRKTAVEEKKEELKQPSPEPVIEPDPLDDFFDKAKKQIREEARKAQTIHLADYADNQNQAAMFLSIEVYINSFSDPSRQLEAAHNLVKKLKLIAAQLQQESVRGSA